MWKPRGLVSLFLPSLCLANVNLFGDEGLYRPQPYQPYDQSPYKMTYVRPPLSTWARAPTYGVPNQPQYDYAPPPQDGFQPPYGYQPIYQPRNSPALLKRPKRLTPEEFGDKLNQLKANLAQPQEIRRHFRVDAPEIQTLADASRRIVFAKKHGYPIPNSLCPPRPQPSCDATSSVRAFDGSCNNLGQPFWGAYLQPVERFFGQEYEDGQFLPRGTTYDFEVGYTTRLPNPRNVSSTFHVARNTSDPLHSHMMVQFAQFIDHDVIALPKDDFDCCRDGFKTLCTCFPVDLRGDAFFSKLNRTCMQLTRSSVSCQAKTSWAEQFSGVTSFLDASTVYGSNPSRAMALRGGESRRAGGRLWVSERLRDFKLPQRADLALLALGYQRGDDFVSGDDRAASQPTLLSLHNVMLLEHNRIARGIEDASQGRLDQLGEKGRDEIIFQEARRVVIAQIQNFVYKELLPSLLGESDLIKHDLKLSINSPYHDNVNPTLRNEFGTAAFRFGHSLVQDIFEGNKQEWRLSSGLSDPRFAIKDGGSGFENEIFGACSQPSQILDRFIGAELTTKLFANKKILGQQGADKAASDLAATNIQRGRDHGLANYNRVRKAIGLTPIDESMQQRPAEISQENWDLLAYLYEKPDDIDLFTGGLAEDHASGAIVGPTFSWIIGEQFRQLKAGDRYFFTHMYGNNPKGLPEKLQRMIHARNLGDVLCENIKSLEMIQVNVMLRPSNENPHKSCNDASRARIDFQALLDHIVQDLTGNPMAKAPEEKAKDKP